MTIIGVAGRLGAGKTLVARLLGERGAEVLDADRMAHKYLERGRKEHDLIVKHFGREILDSQGCIDRARLGEKVFRAREQLEALNRIVHPPLLEEIRKRIDDFRRKDSGSRVLVIDAALLFWWRMDRWCDLALWVDAPEEERGRRVVESGRMSREEFERRDRMQEILSPSVEEENLQRIENRGTRSELADKIDKIWKKVVNHENRKRQQSR